jgi:sensor c-di-GMP phosphodiesterase-like protein
LGQDRTSVIVAGCAINLATLLDLKVVAEGVKSEAALAFLKAHYCQHAAHWLMDSRCAATRYVMDCAT